MAQGDVLMAARETDATDAVVELSAAILLTNYVRVFRRIVFLAAMLCLLWSLGRQRIGFALAAAVFGGLYIGLRRYYRPVLLAFTCIMIPTVASAAGWLLWRSIKVLYHGIGFWHIVPVSAVVLLAYISHRVLRSDINMDDGPHHKPGDTLYADPTFSEVWLSGGWRSVLLLGTPWAIWTFTASREQAGACVLLGASLFAAALIPWALIPCAHAVWAGLPVRIIRAVNASLPKRVNRSYTLFVLRESLKRPIAAALLLIVTLTLGVIVIALLTVWRTSFSGLAILLTLTLWLFFWRYMTRRILSKAVTTVKPASERFTLYLRSFIDDDFRVLRDGLRYRVWLTDQIFNAMRYVRFEEVLAGTLWPFGRLVTLSRPGSKLPDIGALRVKAESADWQWTIMQFVDSAVQVVMAVGFTSGLRWELSQFDPERLSKLILAFVPEHPERAVTTWHQFTLDGPRLSSCGEEVIGRALAARFLRDGSPVFFTARKRSLAGYRLAMLSCFIAIESLEPFIERRARAEPPRFARASAAPGE